MINDGRGKHMIELKKENKRKVLNWIKKNPGKTRNEYCEDLNMSPMTLRTHINDLIEEGELE